VLEARRERLYNAYKPMIVVLNELDQFLRVFDDPGFREFVKPDVLAAMENSGQLLAVLHIEPAAQPLIPVLTQCTHQADELLTKLVTAHSTSACMTDALRQDISRQRAELRKAIEGFHAAVRDQLTALDAEILAPVVLRSAWAELRRAWSGNGVEETAELSKPQDAPHSSPGTDNAARSGGRSA
jgi:hypothetical protein